MTTIRYQGFTILTRPYRLHQSGRWAGDLEIRRHDRRRSFSLDENYATQREAETRCLGIGRRIIDGRIPGWSVDHLRRGSGRLSVLINLFRGASMRESRAETPNAGAHRLKPTGD